MTQDDADLAAVRRALAARTGAASARAQTRNQTLTRTLQAAPVRAPRRRLAERLVPVGAAVAVAALALGVAALRGGEPSPAADLDAPRITEPDQIALPMDEYDFTTEGYRVYHEALAYLWVECLSRFGAEVEPARLVFGPLPAFSHDRRFGVFELEIAQEYGYGVPPGWGEVWMSFQAEPVPPPTPRYGVGTRPGVGTLDAARSQIHKPYPDQLSDDEWFLLLGHADPRFADRDLPEDASGDPLPADGCQGEARRTLAGGLPDPDFTVTNNDAEARASHHPDVIEAQARWRDCMRAAGYDYETSWEAEEGSGRYRGPGRDGPASPEEIADAVANVRCKVESNLVGVLVAVISRYQEEFIAAHQAELAPLKRWLDTVQLNAGLVVAEHE